MSFLANKTAIITGAGYAVLSDGRCGSIGYGIATAYAKEGANLVITGRNLKKLEAAKEALEALLPVLSDEALDFANRDAVFDACKAKAEELGKKNGWLLYPLGIALSGKQRTPGGGTDLACMMGREKTLQRVQAAIAKLNG